MGPLIVYCVVSFVGLVFTALIFSWIFETSKTRKKQDEMAKTLKDILSELKSRS